MECLTSRQQEVLDFIDREVHTRGCPPTLRELAGHFGWKSDNSARQHLRLLAKKGALSTEGGLSRNIRLTPTHPEPRYVPILGQVAAGLPIEAIENREGEVSVDPDMFPEEDLFALKVKGDSMIGIGVHEGDTALIRKQDHAGHGEVVVAMLNGEATIKRFINRGRGHLLQAENEYYDDIPVRPDDDFAILGILTGIVRRY